MSETLHSIALEILKAKSDLANLSATEIHKVYREIYTELQEAEKNYVNEKPGMKVMK